MSDRTRLAAEFRTFATYLGASGELSGPAARYADLHWTSDDGELVPLDRWLLAFARSGPALTALADAYARIVRPYGVLRRKLVLALAVLEFSRGTHGHFDTARPARTLVSWLGLFGLGALWLTKLLVACLVFAPLHVVSKARSRSPSHG